MRLGISVVVCTFNGARLLPETIRHIAQQRVRPDINWEVIIIDNASTDDTAREAVTEWEQYHKPTRFSVLHQPKQGLTYARELAIESSRYEYILFCDDDNWLNPDYVNLAYDLMQQHPAIGVLGGYGELEFEVDPPLWAVGYSSFANGPQAPASGRVKHNIVYGAGFVMRKSAYETISNAGFKPMLTDRVATNLSAGGDYELCYAIALSGYEIWYDERLRFKHFMPKERINWDYCVRFFKEGTQSFDVLIPYRIRVNMGCRNTFVFNIKFAKTFFLYAKKLLPLLVQKFQLSADSEEAKLNSLRIISLKAKILSCKRYLIMKKNFQKILEFEQEKLLVTREGAKALSNRKKVAMKKAAAK